MNSNDLNRRQIEQLIRIVERQQAFLSRLVARMEANHFPKDDRLYVHAAKAYTAMAVLAVCLAHSGAKCGTPIGGGSDCSTYLARKVNTVVSFSGTPGLTTIDGKAG